MSDQCGFSNQTHKSHGLSTGAFDSWPAVFMNFCYATTPSSILKPKIILLLLASQLVQTLHFPVGIYRFASPMNLLPNRPYFLISAKTPPLRKPCQH